MSCYLIEHFKHYIQVCKDNKIISLSNKGQNPLSRPNHAWIAINLGLYNSTHPQVMSL